MISCKLRVVYNSFSSIKIDCAPSICIPTITYEFRIIYVKCVTYMRFIYCATSIWWSSIIVKKWIVDMDVMIRWIILICVIILWYVYCASFVASIIFIKVWIIYIYRSSVNPDSSTVSAIISTSISFKIIIIQREYPKRWMVSKKKI